MSHVAFLDKLNPFLKKSNYVISCLLVIILFLVLMFHLNKEVRDLDIWLHLKTGEQIILNREIPLTDNFSFTKNGEPWINHEWLFQVLTYVFFSNFGFDGLIIMQNIVFIAIFFVLFFMGLRNRNFLFVTTALYILLLNSSYRFTIRPDMFSVLFLTLYIFILKEMGKYLFVLPLLQVIWTNLHGFFFLGPFVIFIFALTQNKIKAWLVLALSLLATIINPQLIKGAIYPLTTFSNLVKDKFIFDFVQELKSPLTFKTLFNTKDWLFLKSLIIISLFSFRFNQKKFNLTLFLLWFLFLLFSLCAVRNIIYFAIVAIISIFYNTKTRFSYDKSFSNERFARNRYYFIGRFSLIFAFSFCMIKNAAINSTSQYYDFDNYRFKSNLWGISLQNFPQKAVDFILKEDLPQNLFNDFNSGSYLIGRAYPQRKVFIDGRTEFYGNEFLKKYQEATKINNKTLEELIESYKLEGFLLTMAMSNFDEKLAKYLFESSKWIPVYFDDKAIVFLKDNLKNKKIIQRFRIDFKNWFAPKVNLIRIGPRIIYPESYIKRARALKDIGCFKASISEARESLKIMPNCAEAFEILGSCYFELKEYESALGYYRIAVALAPKSLDWRNKFALALYKSGYFKEAEIILSTIIKSNPKDSNIYHGLALVYRKQGKLNEAQKMIKESCQYSDNKNFEFLKLQAEILFDLKKYNEALDVSKLALQLQPENNEIKKNIEKIEKIL